MAAKPRTVLQTSCEEYVLEKFFNEYILPWYREKAISAVVYDKARKEIVLLKEKKTKGKKKAPEQAPIVTKGGDSIDHIKDRQYAKEPPAKKPDVPPRRNESKSQGKQQSYTKEDPESQQLIWENAQLKTKVGSMKEKIYKIRADADVDLDEKDQQLQRLRKALEISNAQVEELRLRLSKLAGDKLRQGNASIADLSDTNRPTELGKRFSEIYDNEWSDAFEHIDIDEEEKKVGILHGIIAKAFKFCEKTLEDQTTHIRAILLGLTQEESAEAPVENHGDKTTRTTNIHNTLQDVRKQMSPKTAGNVAKAFVSGEFEQFISAFGIKNKKIPATLQTYAKTCAELCWLMVVCDPPMALSEDKEGAAFDTNVYKPYTRSVRDMKNPVVKLKVWPALKLHDSGPLVAKGVAQPGEGKTK